MNKINLKRNTLFAIIILFTSSNYGIAYGAKPTPQTVCKLTSTDIATNPFANTTVLKAPGGTASVQFNFNVNYTYQTMQGYILPGTLFYSSSSLNFKAGTNTFSLDIVTLKNQQLGTGANFTLTSVDETTVYYGAKNRLISTESVTCQ